jgi:malate/lactate dehydrogenase
MKIGIIGAGRVGCACALAAVVRGSARTIVIVDRTRRRAKAVAADLRYGSPLCPKTTVVDGDYEDLADAELVMITAGVNEKTGAPLTAATAEVDCGYSIRTLRSIATSFRASCAQRLARSYWL